MDVLASPYGAFRHSRPRRYFISTDNQCASIKYLEDKNAWKPKSGWGYSEVPLVIILSTLDYDALGFASAVAVVLGAVTLAGLFYRARRKQIA